MPTPRAAPLQRQWSAAAQSTAVAPSPRTLTELDRTTAFAAVEAQLRAEVRSAQNKLRAEQETSAALRRQCERLETTVQHGVQAVLTKEDMLRKLLKASSREDARRDESLSAAEALRDREAALAAAQRQPTPNAPRPRRRRAQRGRRRVAPRRMRARRRAASGGRGAASGGGEPTGGEGEGGGGAEVRAAAEAAEAAAAATHGGGGPIAAALRAQQATRQREAARGCGEGDLRAERRVAARERRCARGPPPSPRARRRWRRWCWRCRRGWAPAVVAAEAELARFAEAGGGGGGGCRRAGG